MYLFDVKLDNEQLGSSEFSAYSRDNIQDHEFVAVRVIDDLLGLDESQSPPAWLEDVIWTTTYKGAEISWVLARTAARTRYRGLLESFLPDTGEGDGHFAMYASSDDYGSVSYLAWLADLFGVD